jgi:hypothetical protein
MAEEMAHSRVRMHLRDSAALAPQDYLPYFFAPRNKAPNRGGTECPVTLSKSAAKK